MLRGLVGLVILGALAFWGLTIPRGEAAGTYDGLVGDVDRGRIVFAAAGCGSCHMAPGARDEAQLVLAGGQRLQSDFGTFLVPNISPSDQGIAGWSVADLGTAIRRGVSPEGAHYYPALPYTSYHRMKATDVADLHAYLMTLPPDATASLPHELAFPFTIRRSLGLWKWLYADRPFVMEVDGNDPSQVSGRYLVEALAHCGECHTPRGVFGGLDRGRWLAGAPNPSGEGDIPNITPGALDWSEADIVEYLTSGFTPEFDSVGGSMAHVVENMATLTEADRQAVAAYLKRVPAVE
jgi:mono/diheme cytochrome c family protein